MSLWWMDPSWKKTLCAQCGVNIWDNGGDPDWGYCYECYTRILDSQRQQQQEPYPEPPKCDICEENQAAGSMGKYNCCSSECADEARYLMSLHREPDEYQPPVLRSDPNGVPTDFVCDPDASFWIKRGDTTIHVYTPYGDDCSMIIQVIDGRGDKGSEVIKEMSITRNTSKEA